MRPVSHQLLTLLPGFAGLLLVLVSASPLEGGALSYTPNVAWLMTLILVPFYPQSWPRGLAFLLGLLQDILFSTPLGSQALLTLLMVQMMHLQAHRQQSKLFRLNWLDAAGMLIVWHLLLWMLIHLTVSYGAPLRQLLRAALIDALWYPLFYLAVTRSFAALPDAK